MATNGIIELIPSAAPRFVLSVESVTQALKAASFADEPKNVIMQSNIMVSVAPKAAAEVTIGNTEEIISVFKNIKLKIEIPHSM